jgi:hypothetical protein
VHVNLPVPVPGSFAHGDGPVRPGPRFETQTAPLARGRRTGHAGAPAYSADSWRAAPLISAAFASARSASRSALSRFIRFRMSSRFRLER